jgi:hypothetical protein
MISDGVATLESQLARVYNKTGVKEEGGQMALPLMGEAETEETLTDLLRPAEPSTMASTDYYFEQLVKSGLVATPQKKEAQEAAAKAPGIEKTAWTDPRTDPKVIGSFVWGTVMLAPIKTKFGAGKWVTMEGK